MRKALIYGTVLLLCGCSSGSIDTTEAPATPPVAAHDVFVADQRVLRLYKVCIEGYAYWFNQSTGSVTQILRRYSYNGALALEECGT